MFARLLLAAVLAIVVAACDSATPSGEAVTTTLPAPTVTSPPPGDFPDPTELRELSAQERAELQATADRVRPSVVMVGEIRDGDFTSGGSGFVYSNDGLVMTNAHVVADVTGNAAVMRFDGRVVTAEIVGFIESQLPDVAVLRIPTDGLTVAEVGDSNTVRPGDPLLLVGHPVGYGKWLATAGQAYGQDERIINGVPVANLHSNVPGAPGASGGPMFDAAGRVVGLLHGGTADDKVVEPSPPAIIRDRRHWSSIAERAATAAVPITDAIAAADAIVAAGGNLPTWSRPLDVPEFRLEDADLQVLTAADVPFRPSDLAGMLNQALEVMSPGLTVIDAERNPEGYLITFNAPPPTEVIDEIVLPLFSVQGDPLPMEARGVVPPHVVEAEPIPPPSDDDLRILEVLQPILPSIVYILASTGSEKGKGTGSIISEDGYILTNAHVIAGFDDFEVTLYDGRRFPARVVGYLDHVREPDVGVLKIDATGLDSVLIGDPAALQTGSDLFLIGHPADRGFWRISAGSLLQTVRGMHTAVWADMMFAGGNSGGPMVNEHGEVVGLFHGPPPLDIGPIVASPPEVIWGWHDFDGLFGFEDAKLNVAAAVAIDEAMALVEEIIERQGP